MKIIIAGAGRVGTHLAQLFAREKHNIVVVSNNAEQLNAITSRYDLMGKKMLPTSITGLKEIGTGHCDLFIGVTPDENLNINCCMIASKLGAKRTVARVDNIEFLDKQSEEYFKSMGVDLLFIPEMVAAKEIVASVKRSWTRLWWEPEGGNLALIGGKVRHDCCILNIPREAIDPHLDATDALGVALCHFYESQRPVAQKSYSSWKDFVARNADKVAKH